MSVKKKATDEFDDVLEFETSIKQVPCRLKSSTTGESINAAIVELNGDDRDAYLNTLPGRMSQTKDRMNNFKEHQVDLIERALFRATFGKDENSKTIVEELDGKVPRKFIRELPASTQTKIFKKIQEISGLEEESEEKAKND